MPASPGVVRRLRRYYGGVCVLPDVAVAPEVQQGAQEAPTELSRSESAEAAASDGSAPARDVSREPVEGAGVASNASGGSPATRMPTGGVTASPEVVASCSPGSYRCDGVYLMECLLDGSGYGRVQQCSSEALCSASEGRCELAQCAPGSSLCQDNTLLLCNVDGTAFVETPCGSKRCNQSQGRCDTCAPYSKKCDGRRTLVVCKPDGEHFSMEACPREFPSCPASSDRCVKCAVDTDCAASSYECTDNYCDVESYSCRERMSPAGAACETESGDRGFCDGWLCRTDQG